MNEVKFIVILTGALFLIINALLLYFVVQFLLKMLLKVQLYKDNSLEIIGCSFDI